LKIFGIKEIIMEVKIEDNKLHIIIEMQEPTPSASGKTLVVASSYGNIMTNVRVNGQQVTVGVNAYIKKGVSS
jgi:hypothetical protein